MKLVEVLESEKLVYNQFVSQSVTGSFLQSWEWGDWNISQGKKVLRLLFLNEQEKIIASIQLIKVPLAFGWCYLYSPYGPVIEQESFVPELLQCLKNKFIEATFIRIEPRQDNPFFYKSCKKTLNIQPAVSIVLDMQANAEDLLKNMHPKTRYNIKVAQKHNIEIQSELVVTPGHGFYAKEAVELILDTQKRQGYRGHSLEYYKKLINFFGFGNAKNELKLIIYKALYNKEILASGVMLDFGKRRIYLYGGSSESHRNTMAPYLMHWQAILDAKKIGLQYYDFGGSEVSGGGERGFTRFKQGFGGTIENYSGAWDLVLNKFKYYIYIFLRQLNFLKIKIGL